VLDHAPDQSFLGWEVVVKGRDVEADLGGYLPGAQPLEAAFSDLVESGQYQRVPAISPSPPDTPSPFGGGSGWGFPLCAHTGIQPLD
jgi:hypothetical protein